MYDSAMFDEFSLASQTLGTGYVVNSANGGSVSIITDELRDEDSDGTLTDEHGVYEMSAWNVFNSLFRVSASSTKYDTSKKHLLSSILYWYTTCN